MRGFSAFGPQSCCQKAVEIPCRGRQTGRCFIVISNESSMSAISMVLPLAAIGEGPAARCANDS
jgi:hypothetical protein